MRIWGKNWGYVLIGGLVEDAGAEFLLPVANDRELCKGGGTKSIFGLVFIWWRERSTRDTLMELRRSLVMVRIIIKLD